VVAAFDFIVHNVISIIIRYAVLPGEYHGQAVRIIIRHIHILALLDSQVAVGDLNFDCVMQAKRFA